MMADVQVFHNACGFKGEAVNNYGQLTSAPFSTLCHLYGGGGGNVTRDVKAVQVMFSDSLEIANGKRKKKKMKVNKNSDSQAICI